MESERIGKEGEEARERKWLTSTRIKGGEKEKEVLSRHCNHVGDQEVPKEHRLPDQKTTICEVGEGNCPGTEG